MNTAPHPLDDVETLPDFLSALGLIAVVGRPYTDHNPDGHAVTTWPVTITRPTGERLVTKVHGPGIHQEADGSIDMAFDYFNLVLNVKDDYQTFSKWRLRDGIPMTEIAAEWNAYQALKKPLLVFFADPVEREAIDMGLE